MLCFFAPSILFHCKKQHFRLLSHSHLDSIWFYLKLRETIIVFRETGQWDIIVHYRIEIGRKKTVVKKVHRLRCVAPWKCLICYHAVIESNDIPMTNGRGGIKCCVLEDRNRASDVQTLFRLDLIIVRFYMNNNENLLAKATTINRAEWAKLNSNYFSVSASYVNTANNGAYSPHLPFPVIIPAELFKESICHTTGIQSTFHYWMHNNYTNIRMSCCCLLQITK